MKDSILKLQSEIKEFVDDLKNNKNTKLQMGSFKKESEPLDDENDQEYYILNLSGGLNGRGQFLFYMETVAELVKRLMIRFSRVWLIDWMNDCPDDIFELRIGLGF